MKTFSSTFPFTHRLGLRRATCATDGGQGDNLVPHGKFCFFSGGAIGGSGDFDNSYIEREHGRWQAKIGNEPAVGGNVLSVREVLKAHFLVANFFATEGDGLGGLGPRDGGHLLNSALSRQFVEFNGTRKWTDDIQIAATALFGLVKNHPFHDGNKRTALLSVLHLLEKQGRMASVDKRQFESLVVMIAANRFQRDHLHAHLRADYSRDDADVRYIASRLQAMTRRIDRAHHPVTYQQLNGLIRKHGFEFRRPNNNRIDVVRIDDEQAIYRIGFHSMTKQISRKDLKSVRKACNLLESDGVDGKMFFEGTESMDFLLSEYASSLRKLADR